MCVCVCARTHARTHARSLARTHARSYARTLARTYARTHARTHTHARLRTCAARVLHSCMCVACMCMQLKRPYICIYTRTFSRRDRAWANRSLLANSSFFSSASACPSLALARSAYDTCSTHTSSFTAHAGHTLVATTHAGHACSRHLQDTLA